MPAHNWALHMVKIRCIMEQTWTVSKDLDYSHSLSLPSKTETTHGIPLCDQTPSLPPRPHHK